MNPGDSCWLILTISVFSKSLRRTDVKLQKKTVTFFLEIRGFLQNQIFSFKVEHDTKLEFQLMNIISYYV